MEMNSVKQTLPGLLLCLALAIPGWLLGCAFPVVGGPVFAILLGMLAALVLQNKASFRAGIAFTSKKVLQYAVILLGFGLNLSQIAQVGSKSLPIIRSTITTLLVIAFAISRWLKMPCNISVLVGVGSSICGGSAIAATAPVIGADDDEIAQSISVIFLFNILAALFFPTLGGALGMSNEGFGHHHRLHHGGGGCCGVPSAERTVQVLHRAGMAAIGLNTDLVKLIKTGGKPIFMGVCCWAGITGVSLGMQHMMGLL